MNRAETLKSSLDAILAHRATLVAEIDEIDASLRDLGFKQRVGPSTRRADGMGRTIAIYAYLQKHGPSTTKEMREALPDRFTERSICNGPSAFVSGCPLTGTLESLKKNGRLEKSLGSETSRPKWSIVPGAKPPRARVV